MCRFGSAVEVEFCLVLLLQEVVRTEKEAVRFCGTCSFKGEACED